MSFRDLDEFFDSSLQLPIGGRVYAIPSPDGETGLWVQRVIALGEKTARGQQVSDDQAASLELDDDEERSLHERLLGPVLDDMIEDGCSWEQIKLAGNTAMVWTGFGLEAAERFWNSGGLPEAQAPEAKKPQDRKIRAVGQSTRKRGSESGTTPRRSSRTVAGEVVTPGENSSATGS